LLDDVESGVLQEGQALSLAGDFVVVEFDEEERFFVLWRLGQELPLGVEDVGARPRTGTELLPLLGWRIPRRSG